MTTKRLANELFPWTLLVGLLCAAAVGCGSSDTPVVPPAAPPAAATPDEKVLLALGYYDPVYKRDADGRVTHLMLAGRHLPPAVLAEIGKLTELRHLDIYGTTVTDDGLALLKDLQKLKELGLGSTPVTDKGLVHLEKLNDLQHVWLAKSSATKAGAEKLKDARPDLNVHSP
jgi:hypothetical protein